MHYLYFVAVKKDKETKKEGLIEEVNSQLESENFAGDGCYWGGSKCDWFVMGGRWSGHLQEIQLDGWHEKARAIVEKNRDEKDPKYDFFTEQDIAKNGQALQELWLSLGGTGKNTWARDSFKDRYGEDDCMLLDRKLYEALKKGKYEDTEVARLEDGYIYDEMLLTDFLKDESVVDNYYLCVVDYHN